MKTPTIQYQMLSLNYFGRKHPSFYESNNKKEKLHIFANIVLFKKKIYQHLQEKK